MGSGRRLAVLLMAVTLIGLPAAVLRVACVGASCRSTAAATSAPAPFCSLPATLRDLIGAGAYEGRSPDVMAVTASTQVVTDVGDGVKVPWPSEEAGEQAAMKVPLWFIGRGIVGKKLPDGTTVDRIAPTLEPLLGLQRAHRDVRSGTAIPGVVKPGSRSPLVVVLVWKGIGQPDLRTRLRPVISRLSVPLIVAPATPKDGSKRNFLLPFLSPYMAGVDAATGAATTGSLPLDPVAIEATIGSGGLPSQHGITGTSIRNGDGRVVESFGRGSPQPVIATLGDDLDRATGGAARIGLVETAPGDMALTGDAWYGTGRIVDRITHARRGDQIDVMPFLRRGWGEDEVPDLLAIGIQRPISADERALATIETQVFRSVPHATIVVAGTGSLDVRDAVDASGPSGTDTLAAGGAFVQPGTPAQTVVDALHAQTATDGSPLFADAFASYAVQFGRYC